MPLEVITWEGFFVRMEKWINRWHLYSTGKISCACFLRVPVTFLLHEYRYLPHEELHTIVNKKYFFIDVNV